jgi:nucleotide-binding universal stress UspA family protein
LWGSTAEEIIAEAPCPVLTLKPPQHDFVEHRGQQTEIHLKRILLATNFRPSSIAATHLAREMATATNAELHAVYVIGDYFEQISVMFPEGANSALSRMRAEVQERMQTFAGEGDDRVLTHVAEGRPYAEIVRLAAEIDADLIVIGTSIHGSLFGGAPALGSEIERVVRNAPCPVLCVPSGRVVTPLPAFARPQPVPQT